MNEKTFQTLKQSDQIILSLQRMLLGTHISDDYIPDTPIQIPEIKQSENIPENDENYQKMNLEIYTQKLKISNKEKKQLLTAVDHFIKENNELKEINFQLTLNLFKNSFQPPSNYFNRNLIVNYEFINQENQKQRTLNEQQRDQLLLLKIENDQLKAKINKLDQQKGRNDRQTFKDNLFFDNNVLKEINLQQSQVVDKIDSVEPQVQGIQEKSNNTIGDNLTANTSKLSQKSNSNLVNRPSVTRKIEASNKLNQTVIQEDKKKIVPTPTLKKKTSVNDSVLINNKQDIKKKK